MKGQLIVFEGIDGSGKSTQADLIYKYFANKHVKVLATKEPTNSIIGTLVRSALEQKCKIHKESLQLLFTADRAEHVNQFRKYLRKGWIVLSDRYFFSTIAYGAASGLDYEWLVNLNSVFPYPNVTIIIDVPPEIAIKRLNSKSPKKELFEKQKFLSKVRQFYLKIASEFKRVYVVDGAGSINQTKKNIIDILNKTL